MRRPTRTRRLSIAAMVSLLLFVVVAAAGVQSLGKWYDWNIGYQHGINLVRGLVIFRKSSGLKLAAYSPGFYSSDAGLIYSVAMPSRILGFGLSNETYHGPIGDLKEFLFIVPVWFPLLLLLIAPMRWLVARPVNAPAFPVITDAKQSN